MSRIPLWGLPHSVDVIRKTPSDDTAGGIVPEGTEVTVYSGQSCRISMLQENKDILEGFGIDSGKAWRIVMAYSPKVQRTDFIRIPWDTIPNVMAPVGLPDGTPASATVSTGNPIDATILFTWDGSVWTDDATSTVVLSIIAGLWHFSNSEDSLSFDVCDEDFNPWYSAAWAEEASAYAITFPDATLDYRIVWMKQHIDDVGGTHHTSLIFEELGTDA